MRGKTSLRILATNGDLAVRTPPCSKMAMYSSTGGNGGFMFPGTRGLELELLVYLLLLDPFAPRRSKTDVHLV